MSQGLSGRWRALGPAALLAAGWGVATLLAAPPPAHAQAQGEDPAAAVCRAEDYLDGPRLLRRLSLDLRGRAPTVEEYAALDGGSAPSPELLTELLSSDEFRVTMRRYHEQLLWPNVSNVQLTNVNARLATAGTGADYLITQDTNRRRFWRGDADLVTDGGRHCGDYEQTNFLPGGDFVPDPAFIQKGADGGQLQEGWRYVTPYWDPTTPIKVCAFEAQETTSVTLADGGVVSCDQVASNSPRECGCGPNLRQCTPPSRNQVEIPLLQSFREQVGRAVDEVTVGGKPYTELLLGTKAWEDGRIAFWKRHTSKNFNYGRAYVLPDPGETPANVPFTDTTWRQIDRGAFHSGVSTLPAYLLRFQTNRSRANRLRIAFECQSFQPPADLPRDPGCSDTTDDLVNRCGCQYCHKQLEPLASAYGRFAEAGSTYLAPQNGFPADDPFCRSRPGDARCRRFYVTETGAYGRGRLVPFQFFDLHPEIDAALEGGVRARSQALVDSGAFASCTVRRVFAHLVKRELLIGGRSEEAELLESLQQGFVASGYSFPWLVREIVLLPQYRRVRP